MEHLLKSQNEKNSFTFMLKDFISLSRNKIDTKINTIMKILYSMKEDNEKLLFKSKMKSINLFF